HSATCEDNSHAIAPNSCRRSATGGPAHRCAARNRMRTGRPEMRRVVCYFFSAGSRKLARSSCRRPAEGCARRTTTPRNGFRMRDRATVDRTTMRVSVVFGCLAALSALALPASPAAQAASPLGGVWAFNRSLSDLPREIGFNVNWAQSSGGTGQNASPTGGGGRGRRGGSGGGGGRSGGAFPIIHESYEDSQRVQLLTAEARTPPARLMIVDTPDAVTFTNELGQSRTFHPSGRQESIEIQGAQTFVTARRDGDRLHV